MSKADGPKRPPRRNGRRDRLASPAPAGEKPHPSLFEIEDRYLYERKMYEPGSLEDIHFQFTRRLTIVARQWRTRLDERLKTIGQTQARWAVLFWILASEENTTQQELADRIGVEGPTLVFILNRLEQEGLVERRPLESDRRAKTIRLTEAAEPVVAEIRRITGLLRAEVLAGITPEELAGCIAVFNRIRTNLEGT